jgi:hypothetical protein
MEVVEGLLLYWIAGERGDKPIDESMESAIDVLPCLAPASLTLGNDTAALTREAADRAAGRFLQKCELNERI